MIQVNLFTKQKQTHRLREPRITRGEGCGEGIIEDFGIDIFTLLYLKWHTKKGLLGISRKARGILLNVM